MEEKLVQHYYFTFAAAKHRIFFPAAENFQPFLGGEVFDISHMMQQRSQSFKMCNTRTMREKFCLPSPSIALIFRAAFIMMLVNGGRREREGKESIWQDTEWVSEWLWLWNGLERPMHCQGPFMADDERAIRRLGSFAYDIHVRRIRVMTIICCLSNRTQGGNSRWFTPQRRRYFSNSHT